MNLKTSKPQNLITLKPNMKQKLALASWVIAVVLSVVALLLPPTGVIDNSVIILVAQFLLLCATFLGVDSYVNMIKSHMNEKKS